MQAKRRIFGHKPEIGCKITINQAHEKQNFRIIFPHLRPISHIPHRSLRPRRDTVSPRPARKRQHTSGNRPPRHSRRGTDFLLYRPRTLAGRHGPFPLGDSSRRIPHAHARCPAGRHLLSLRAFRRLPQRSPVGPALPDKREDTRPQVPRPFLSGIRPGRSAPAPPRIFPRTRHLQPLTHRRPERAVPRPLPARRTPGGYHRDFRLPLGDVPHRLPHPGPAGAAGRGRPRRARPHRARP